MPPKSSSHVKVVFHPSCSNQARLARTSETLRIGLTERTVSSGARRLRSTSPLGRCMSPAFDRISRSAEPAEPVEEADSEHVEADDPDPCPHGLNGMSGGLGGFGEIELMPRGRAMRAHRLRPRSRR